VRNEDGVTFSLEQLQEDWFQDVVPVDLGPALRRGLDWRSEGSADAARWSLSGRDIYVLAEHKHLSGYISTARLVLGEKHVVVCTLERANEVRAAIAATGGPTPQEFGEELGAPLGWIGFRGVEPRVPVAPSADGDLLDSLCPLPDIVIDLDGGIRLEFSSWLAGFPPRVHVTGDVSSAGDVVIDGQKAQPREDLGYAVAGWDALGNHTVWCAGKSATYSIVEGIEEWKPWEAYKWSLGDETPVALDRPAICGALILPPAVRRLKNRDSTARRSVVVPASNPVLIGPSPGDIYTCAVRSDLSAKDCNGFPDFDPMWALPANALHCDKRIARVLCLGALRKPQGGPSAALRSLRAGWASAILTASRKGLQTFPASEEVRHLWSEYRRTARALARERR
jgi:hypothetical protein